MVDSNQVFDVQPAIDYVKQLKPLSPWFIEGEHRRLSPHCSPAPSLFSSTHPSLASTPFIITEPTAPDDISGHAQIRKGLKPYGIGVATGEHASALLSSLLPHSPSIQR